MLLRGVFETKEFTICFFRFAAVNLVIGFSGFRQSLECAGVMNSRVHTLREYLAEYYEIIFKEPSVLLSR